MVQSTMGLFGQLALYSLTLKANIMYEKYNQSMKIKDVTYFHVHLIYFIEVES